MSAGSESPSVLGASVSAKVNSAPSSCLVPVVVAGKEKRSEVSGVVSSTDLVSSPASLGSFSGTENLVSVSGLDQAKMVGASVSVSSRFECSVTAAGSAPGLASALRAVSAESAPGSAVAGSASVSGLDQTKMVGASDSVSSRLTSSVTAAGSAPGLASAVRAVLAESAPGSAVVGSASVDGSSGLATGPVLVVSPPVSSAAPVSVDTTGSCPSLVLGARNSGLSSGPEAEVGTAAIPGERSGSPGSIPDVVLGIDVAPAVAASTMSGSEAAVTQSAVGGQKQSWISVANKLA